MIFERKIPLWSNYIALSSEVKGIGFAPRFSSKLGVIELKDVLKTHLKLYLTN